MLVRRQGCANQWLDLSGQDTCGLPRCLVFLVWLSKPSKRWKSEVNWEMWKSEIGFLNELLKIRLPLPFPPKKSWCSPSLETADLLCLGAKFQWQLDNQKHTKFGVAILRIWNFNWLQDKWCNSWPVFCGVCVRFDRLELETTGVREEGRLGDNHTWMQWFHRFPRCVNMYLGDMFWVEVLADVGSGKSFGGSGKWERKWKKLG